MSRKAKKKRKCNKKKVNTKKVTKKKRKCTKQKTTIKKILKNCNNKKSALTITPVASFEDLWFPTPSQLIHATEDIEYVNWQKMRNKELKYKNIFIRPAYDRLPKKEHDKPIDYNFEVPTVRKSKSYMPISAPCNSEPFL